MRVADTAGGSGRESEGPEVVEGDGDIGVTLETLPAVRGQWASRLVPAFTRSIWLGTE